VYADVGDCRCGAANGGLLIVLAAGRAKLQTAKSR